MLRLQRPEKTSRTSSKPPATDRKERRDKARPGGAKHGHEGKARAMSETFDRKAPNQPAITRPETTMTEAASTRIKRRRERTAKWRAERQAHQMSIRSPGPFYLVSYMSGSEATRWTMLR